MKTVVLKTFDNYFDAHITLTKLQGEGIECHLLNEHMAGLNPGLSNMYGDIKLIIKDTDSAAATELMKRFEEEYLRSAKCPRCQANQIISLPKPRGKGFWMNLLVVLFLAPVPTNDFVYHCKNCGWEGKNLPDANPDKELPYNEEIEE